jgi:hypothetical protein
MRTGPRGHNAGGIWRATQRLNSLNGRSTENQNSDGSKPHLRQDGANPNRKNSQGMHPGYYLI